jgi:hypothetical protein
MKPGWHRPRLQWRSPGLAIVLVVKDQGHHQKEKWIKAIKEGRTIID